MDNVLLIITMETYVLKNNCLIFGFVMGNVISNYLNYIRSQSRFIAKKWSISQWEDLTLRTKFTRLFTLLKFYGLKWSWTVHKFLLIIFILLWYSLCVLVIVILSLESYTFWKSVNWTNLKTLSYIVFNDYFGAQGLVHLYLLKPAWFARLFSFVSLFSSWGSFIFKNNCEKIFYVTAKRDIALLLFLSVLDRGELSLFRCSGIYSFSIIYRSHLHVVENKSPLSHFLNYSSFLTGFIVLQIFIPIFLLFISGFNFVMKLEKNFTFGFSTINLFSEH